MRSSSCWILVAAAAAGCSGGGEPETPAERGARVYGNVCTVCHNADPSQEGTLGPAIAGSSRELLEARVLRGEYPPGYTPKRPTALMPPLPYLEASIPDLVAFLSDATGS